MEKTAAATRLCKRLFHKNSWSIALVPEQSQEHMTTRWAIIKDTTQGPILEAYGTAPSITEALEHLPKAPQDDLYLASVFPSLPTIVHHCELPKLRQEEIPAALLDVLEQSLSSQTEQTSIAYSVSCEKEDNMQVCAYVARTKQLQEHLDTLQTERFDPEWLLPKAACLASFISFFSLLGWSYIVDTAESETTVILLLDGQVVECRTLIGGAALFAHINENTSADTNIHQLLQHVSETIFAYQQRHALPEDTPLTLTGALGSQAHICSTVATFVGAPLSILHKAGDPEILTFASAIGGAFLCRSQTQTAYTPNFRNQTQPFSDPLLHWKRPLCVLLAACLSLCGTLGWYGQHRTKAITQQMHSNWTAIAQLAQVESQIPANESAKELVERAEQLSTSLEKNALFPLHPDIPRVKDVVTWISTQISTLEEHENGSSYIRLQSLKYQLIKRPNKKNPKEHYQVRVELELSSPSVTLARAFHDMLLQPNEFVDPSSQISWTTSKDTYRTSFILKDKTSYPRMNI